MVKELPMQDAKQDFPISPARLKHIRWRGERAYRVLSYSFSVRWNGDVTDDRIDYVFGGVTVSQSNGPPGNPGADGASVYSLVDLGPRQEKRFRLLLGDEQLVGSRAADGVLDNLLYQILTRTRELTEEFLLIHAGSVVTSRGEGVLLPAAAGSGKTTLVAGLIRSGFGFLSDEIGVIDHGGGVLRPYPRALNFKNGAQAIFPDLAVNHNGSPFSRGVGYLRAEEIRPDVMASPSEVRFVIAPRYVDGATTLVTALSPGEMVKELWANALNIDAYGARALPILANVARGAKGFRLLSGDLGEAVRAVDQITGRG
jgi:hypothetical protein